MVGRDLAGDKWAISDGLWPGIYRLTGNRETMSSETREKIQSERDEALATLSDVVEHARYKSLGDGRIRSPEKERIRLKYLRVIVSALDSRRQYLADKDLDELAEEIESLKEQYEADVDP